jgi:hypothetical protein
VLVGDTSSSTLLSAYPQIAQEHPDQIACIFIRNTSATDSDDKIPYDTSPFKNVNSSQYFFYRVPEGMSFTISHFCIVLRDITDLYNLDIAGGQCQNSSIPQNVCFCFFSLNNLMLTCDYQVTFGEQGGILDHGNGAMTYVPRTLSWPFVVAVVGMLSLIL